jgi:hypothetical protein
VILALLWFPNRWIERRARTPLAADVCIYLFAGVTGLTIEWFILGNSPWQNPEANDLGMFCFWTVVLAMPRLLLDNRPHLRSVRRAVGVCFPAFAAAALAVGFATPQAFRLFVLVVVVVVGYVGMNSFFARALFLEWRHTRSGTRAAQRPLPA